MELVITKTTSLGLTAAELCSGVAMNSVIMEKLQAKCNGKCDGICYIISVEEIASHTQPYLSADSGDGSGFLTVRYVARTLQYAPQYIVFAPITMVHVDSRFICESPTTIFNALDRSEMLTGSEAHQKQFIGLHVPLIISASTYVASRKAQCVVSMMRAPPVLTLAWGDPTITPAQREYITGIKPDQTLSKPAAAALKILTGGAASEAAMARTDPAEKFVAAALKSAPASGSIQLVANPAGPAVRKIASGGAGKSGKSDASPTGKVDASSTGKVELVSSPVTLGFVLATVAEHVAAAAEFRRQLSAAIATDDDFARHKVVWDYYKKL